MLEFQYKVSDDWVRVPVKKATLPLVPEPVIAPAFDKNWAGVCVLWNLEL